MTKIVILNGVGSVGKSSIAHALQARTREPFLHLGLDTFISMMPQNKFGTSDGLTFETADRGGRPIVTAITSGPFFERLMQGMLHTIAVLAEQGHNLIVDDVMLADRSAEYARLLARYEVFRIGVFAPLPVLEHRERARGDRAIGLARWQFERVHHGIRYDLEVDTSEHTAEECADQIIARFGL